MNRLLIVGLLLLSTVPLCAQAQQPNMAKLKADGGQMVEAAHEKDSKKAEALSQRVDDLEKQLGPEYHALFDALYDADPNSKDVQDILSMFNKLDESCPH